jgi:6-phosphogluconolactonase (cycloisomerase 2 family)
MTMNLYLVRNPDGVPVWVAFESDQKRLYTYVQNTGKFHLNAGLYEDFYFDHTMTYETVDQQAAEAAILSGVGLRDERSFVHILARYRRDQDALSPETVFGALWSTR